MSATGAGRPAIADGLRDLADFLDLHPHLIDERNQPGQHEDVTFIVRDASTVHEFAAETYSVVDSSPDSDGNVHTRAEVHFGRGSEEHSTDAYSNAVTLRVVHIEDAS